MPATTRPSTAVATCNMRNTAHPFTITPTQAETALRKVLASVPAGVDLIGLQEWAGTARNGILRRMGRATFVPTLTRALTRGKRTPTASGWLWVRPQLGGPWVGAKASRYSLRFCRSKTLAPPMRLEHVPGFRSLMGASQVTVAGFYDHDYGDVVVVIDGHLTRHVEKGGRYRVGLPKTTSRHKREVAALSRVIGYHVRHGRRVYVTIDGNYDGLDLPGVVECWEGHPKSETGGTLGARRPEIVAGPGRAARVLVIPTISDHDSVVAVYP